MEYLDICDENGQPTGQCITRSEAHRQGILHRTAHVWIVRKENGRTEVLLQKRSMQKESFPGLYDTSSAGHIATAPTRAKASRAKSRCPPRSES